jgi:spore coat polysaccharide biosynthesis predicted glycosyltransferase SpsG
MMRCISLAQILERKFAPHFALIDSDDSVVTLTSDKYPTYRTSVSDISVLKQLKSDIHYAVTDGYIFTENHLLSLTQIGYELACIDDLASNRIPAKLVVNHCTHFLDEKYKSMGVSMLATGFEYALLRNEFLTSYHHKTEYIHGKAFVCLGGSDPFGITFKVLSVLKKMDTIHEIVILQGAAFQAEEKLNSLVTEVNRQKKVNVLKSASPNKIQQEIASSEIAFTTSSTIALEVCSVGCGLITGTVADNQFYLNKELVDNSCALSVGDWNNTSEEQILSVLKNLPHNWHDQCCTNQKNKFDGKSSERLLSIFCNWAQC